MGIINVLDFSVANLIAAGEVVDRPASVIKELIENSMDAGATDITVEIKRGGITFMRVSDNGKGIAREDLPIAVKRHATSKIHSADDLDSIMTLGFRGEALAAIASVSKLRILSKTPDCECGYMLSAVGGENVTLTEAGASDGTTVIVEDLFANVPARLKFLKKDITEAMAVSAYVEKMALSRPDIAFRLIVDGNMRFMTTGDGKLANVIYILLGRDFAKRLIPIDFQNEYMRMQGYISTPDNIRANRNFQNFFINHRFIKSKTISAALEQAYSTFIPTDKFPCAVLHIEISPSSVDVNVHPAKLEVKFSNEKPIFESVYSAVRQALESRISRPEFKMDMSSTRRAADDYIRRYNSFTPIPDRNGDGLEQLAFASKAPCDANSGGCTPSVSDFQNKFSQSDEGVSKIPDMRTVDSVKKNELQTEDRSNAKAFGSSAPLFDSGFYDSGRAAHKANEPSEPFLCDSDNSDKRDASDTTQTSEIKASPADLINSGEQLPDRAQNADERDVKAEPEESLPEFRIIGEAFFSYVFVEVGDSVIIIDKHAAHERIIFEELKRNMQKRSVISQMLLVPLEIVLSRTEAEALSDYSEELHKTGFEYEIVDNIVKLSAIPTALDIDGAVPMIQTIAGRVSDGTGNFNVSKEIIYERALFQASCKAAIKIGRNYDSEHLKWICGRVIALDIIKFCPHGRPVAFELTRHDFERQFKRV